MREPSWRTCRPARAWRSSTRTAEPIAFRWSGFLGGNATAGAVAQFNSWQTASGRRVVAGLAEEVVQRLRRYEGAGEHHTFVMSTGHRMDRVEYAPEVLKLVLDDMVSEAGVQPLLHATLLDADVARARPLVVPANAGTHDRPLRSISSIRE